MIAAADRQPADRLGKMTDADAVADELFVSVLSRRPTAEEQKDVAEVAEGRPRTADRDSGTGLGAGRVRRVPVQPLT